MSERNSIKAAYSLNDNVDSAIQEIAEQFDGI